MAFSGEPSIDPETNIHTTIANCRNFIMTSKRLCTSLLPKFLKHPESPPPEDLPEELNEQEIVASFDTIEAEWRAFDEEEKESSALIEESEGIGCHEVPRSRSSGAMSASDTAKKFYQRLRGTLKRIRKAVGRRVSRSRSRERSAIRRGSLSNVTKYLEEVCGKTRDLQASLAILRQVLELFEELVKKLQKGNISEEIIVEFNKHAHFVHHLGLAVHQEILNLGPEIEIVNSMCEGEDLDLKDEKEAFAMLRERKYEFMALKMMVDQELSELVKPTEQDSALRKRTMKRSSTEGPSLDDIKGQLADRSRELGAIPKIPKNIRGKQSTKTEPSPTDVKSRPTRSTVKKQESSGSRSLRKRSSKEELFSVEEHAAGPSREGYEVSPVKQLKRSTTAEQSAQSSDSAERQLATHEEAESHDSPDESSKDALSNLLGSTSIREMPDRKDDGDSGGVGISC